VYLMLLQVKRPRSDHTHMQAFNQLYSTGIMHTSSDIFDTSESPAAIAASRQRQLVLLGFFFV